MEELACLNFGSGECVGEVEPRLVQPVRYRNNGEFVVFPRCERHYDEYADEADRREMRQRLAEQAERDEWANFE